VRAAVPEELGNLDLVGTADRRLGRHHTLIMLALLVFPLPRRCRHIGLGQQDSLLFGLGLRRRLLHDFERFFIPGGLGNGVGRCAVVGRQLRSGLVVSYGFRGFVGTASA
jgi:hypothetical protein